MDGCVRPSSAGGTSFQKSKRGSKLTNYNSPMEGVQCEQEQGGVTMTFFARPPGGGCATSRVDFDVDATV